MYYVYLELQILKKKKYKLLKNNYIIKYSKIM